MKIEQQLDIIIDKLGKLLSLKALEYAGNIQITPTERAINLYKIGFTDKEIAVMMGKTLTETKERTSLIKEARK